MFFSFFWLDIRAPWLFSSSTCVFRFFIFLRIFFPRYQFVEFANCTICEFFSHQHNYRLDIKVNIHIYIYIYIYIYISNWVLGLCSSSLYSQCFSRYVLQPSSGVLCQIREPTQNLELFRLNTQKISLRCTFQSNDNICFTLCPVWQFRVKFLDLKT